MLGKQNHYLFRSSPLLSAEEERKAAAAAGGGGAASQGARRPDRVAGQAQPAGDAREDGDLHHAHAAALRTEGRGAWLCCALSIFTSGCILRQLGRQPHAHLLAPRLSRAVAEVRLRPGSAAGEVLVSHTRQGQADAGEDPQKMHGCVGADYQVVFESRCRHGPSILNVSSTGNESVSCRPRLCPRCHLHCPWSGAQIAARIPTRTAACPAGARGASSGT